MQNDAEVLWGNEKIADELSRMFDQPVSPQKAAYWGRRGIIPVEKAGPFTFTTKTKLRERFGLKSNAA